MEMELHFFSQQTGAFAAVEPIVQQLPPAPGYTIPMTGIACHCRQRAVSAIGCACSQWSDKAGTAVVGKAPFAFDPAVEFEALESRIEGALLHLENVIGKLAEQLSDGIAVESAAGQGLEDHHVKSAGQQIVLSHRLSEYTVCRGQKFPKSREISTEAALLQFRQRALCRLAVGLGLQQPLHHFLCFGSLPSLDVNPREFR
jgi:hypothetical protein